MLLALSARAITSDGVCKQTVIQSIVTVHLVLHLETYEECEVRSRARAALSETRD